MKLFEPGRIGKLFLGNRIVMAPMGTTGLSDPDGRFSQRAIDYFVARAKGGVGLIISGMTYVTRDIELRPTIPVVDSDIHISALSELADAVHDHGSKIAIQLTAGFGRVSPPRHRRETKPVAPSVLPCFWDPETQTRALTIDEVEDLVHAFERSAELLQAAGIDAVELHGHEGYLLDQFKTSLWNRRTDKYGGDLEGRLRFPLEVIAAIKRGAGADFPVIYRLGLVHYLEGGREIEEGLEISRRLETAGVEALEVDAGCYETWYWAHPPITQPPGCMANMAEMAKGVVHIPVIAVGKLGYPDLAEEMLQKNEADFVALGRALLADPEWPNKVKKGRLEDIRPCIGDHEGCLDRIVAAKYLSCTVNPATGMERELALKPAKKKRKVLVVGGGPAGMEAARVAAIRGHNVTLWEKSDALGGNLIPGSVPDFKHEYYMLLEYLSRQIKKLGVSVHVGKEATINKIRKMAPNVVFIATGSSHIIPNIPGINKGNVMTAIDTLMDKQGVGRSVVVLGGGLVGCETGLYLAQQGRKVTILEILSDLATGISVSNRMHLLELLAKSQVKLLTETILSEIMDDHVVATDAQGRKHTIESETVVIAVGLRSNNILEESLKDEAFDVHTIGDCVRPGKLINAIWEAYRSARLI